MTHKRNVKVSNGKFRISETERSSNVRIIKGIISYEFVSTKQRVNQVYYLHVYGSEFVGLTTSLPGEVFSSHRLLG